VQTLAASGLITADAEALPRALADLLVGRLDGLPDDARAVVCAAAVVAHPIADRLLRQVLALTDDAMDEAIRVVVAEGLLEPQGAEYAFAHDILRTAVYDDLLPGKRTRLHAAYAAALESGAGGNPAAAEVAHHFSKSHDDPKTLTWSAPGRMSS
jgi:predicted ATPase